MLINFICQQLALTSFLELNKIKHNIKFVLTLMKNNRKGNIIKHIITILKVFIILVIN